jgi:hypothetical protein
MSRRLAKTVVVLTLGAIAITGCETVGKTVKGNPKTTIGAAGGVTVGGLIAATASATPPGSPPAWSAVSWWEAWSATSWMTGTSGCRPKPPTGRSRPLLPARA